jgi:hypothetical protein
MYNGLGCVVGIATAYGLDGPGIESRWVRDFPQLSRPALRPTQPLKMSTRDLSCGKGAPCVWLMTYHPRTAECLENVGP